MPRGKQREERWIGSHWEVIVNDGKGDNWYSFFEATLGPVVSKRGGMDRETALDISCALRAAANFLDEIKHPPRGGAKIVQLPKSKEAKD